MDDICATGAQRDIPGVADDSPALYDAALEKEAASEAVPRPERSLQESAAVAEMIDYAFRDLEHEARRSLGMRIRNDALESRLSGILPSSNSWRDMSRLSALEDDEDFIMTRNILRRNYEQEMDRLLEKQLVRHHLKQQQEESERQQEESVSGTKEGGIEENSDNKNTVDGDEKASASKLNATTQRSTELTIVPWRKFRSVPANNDYDERPIVHILEGEPQFNLLRNSSATTSKSDVYSGATELPERMRITSNFAMRFLRLLSGPEYKAHVILTRPFIWLIFNETRIRSFVGDLESAISTRSNPEMTNAKNLETDQNDLNDQENERKNLLSEGTTTDLEELKAVVKFIDIYIKKREAFLQSPAAKEIYFSDLPLLFRPRDMVISANESQAYQVIGVKFPKHRADHQWAAVYYRDENKQDRTAIIRCISIDFDGQRIGPVIKDFEITFFTGTKSLASLPIHRLEFRAQLDSAWLVPGKRTSEKTSLDSASRLLALKKDLIERGRVFLANIVPQHMQYSGPNIATREEIDSRVVIDFEEGFTTSSGSDWKKLISAVTSSGFSDDDDEDNGCVSSCCFRQYVYQPEKPDNRWEEYVKDSLAKHFETAYSTSSDSYLPLNFFPHTAAEVQSSMEKVSDDCLLIMSYRAIGYVLRDRAWAIMDVGLLQKLEAKSHDTVSSKKSKAKDTPGKGFHDLVLPVGHEDMVVSLIAQHARNKLLDRENKEQYDIVQGKGKGLIILLHGAPGVGKTTTAEAAAEKFNKPLLQITCGDLGSTAREVEEALKLNFNLASRWSSVLLLDEADVFLATRRREDFARNALVAVFLRTLEYYSGILFLTTNRVGDFDEAFKSRIHMSLYYPQLNMESAWKIFNLNFDIIRNRYYGRKQTIDIEKRDIEAYVKEYWTKHKNARWNGRQIRNACQTALALAEFRALKGHDLDDASKISSVPVQLGYEDFETVANAYLQFNKYITKIQGADDGTYAFRRGLRADNNWDEPSDEPPKTLMDLVKLPDVQASSSMTVMQRAGQMDANQAEPAIHNVASPLLSSPTNYPPPPSPVPSGSTVATNVVQATGQYYRLDHPVLPAQNPQSIVAPSGTHQAQTHLHVPQTVVSGYNGAPSGSTPAIDSQPSYNKISTPVPSTTASVMPSAAQRSSAAQESSSRASMSQFSQADSSTSSQTGKRRDGGSIKACTQ